MSVVLSVAQARALIELLAELDDRQISLSLSEELLVVDPQVVRDGGDDDDRMFYLSKSGSLVDIDKFDDEDVPAKKVVKKVKKVKKIAKSPVAAAKKAAAKAKEVVSEASDDDIFEV